MSHLLARRAGRLFALDLDLVGEVLAAPALSPLAETPAWIVGAFQLEERLIPVLDLSRRLHLEGRPLTPDQQIVVAGGLGLLFDQVASVGELTVGPVEPLPEGGLPADSERFLQGMAPCEEGIALVLDWSKLAHLPALAHEQTPGDLSTEGPELLRERAQLYRERRLAPGLSDTEEPLLLLQLGPEIVALPGSDVVEIAGVRDLCPIPGCPEHVVGLSSLRGSLHLLLDLRPTLNLPTPPAQEFALLRDPAVGLLADRVVDFIFAVLQPADSMLSALPDSVVVKGCVIWQGRLVAVIDPVATFGADLWVVDHT